MSQPTYMGFERDVFKTVADYFLSLPEPLLTFEYYELFVNILGTYLISSCGIQNLDVQFRTKREVPLRFLDFRVKYVCFRMSNLLYCTFC